MKRRFLRFGIVVLMLLLTGCANLKEEYLYYYNDIAYTSKYTYGYQIESIGLQWRFVSIEENQWENIIVTAEWGEEEAQKIKHDTNVDFIRIHDMLCARKDFEFPTVEKNKEDIVRIEFSFHGTLRDKLVTLTEKNEIEKISEIIIKGEKNTQKTNDYTYEYVGEVDVFYEGLPVVFSAGRILKNKNGDLFFSSRSNPNIKTNSLLTSLYSIPLEISF